MPLNQTKPKSTVLIISVMSNVSCFRDYSKAIITIIITTNRLIGLADRVFANGPGDLGSISGHVIPKTFKMVLDTSKVNTQPYKVSRVKWSNPGNREVPSPASRCRNYWKGSLLVALDYGRQLYYFIIIIHSLELFTSALAGGFSLESEWQWVYSSLKDSSQYSSCSQ